MRRCLARPYVRKFAAFGLTAIGAEAALAVPRLKGALGDKSPNVRTDAMSALAVVCLGNTEAAKSVVPDLLSILRDKDESKPVRTCAALALVTFGSDVKEAAPILVR